MTSKQTLKNWFSNLKKPTQNHFWAWMDSYFHKEEKIPMQNIEGLDKVLENTASNEQMNNHFSDANAHKSLFDLKVNKEEGKGLSTNDYSNEEKQKLQETANKVVLGISITGDVNKTLTLTREDGSVITTQFTDKDTTDNSPDIKLNSLNFDPQTGILKGVRSDNQELDVNLDGRYSLLNHKHSWNDLADKPNIIYPESEIFLHKISFSEKQKNLDFHLYKTALYFSNAYELKNLPENLNLTNNSYKATLEVKPIHTQYADLNNNFNSIENFVDYYYMYYDAGNPIFTKTEPSTFENKYVCVDSDGFIRGFLEKNLSLRQSLTIAKIGTDEIRNFERYARNPFIKNKTDFRTLQGNRIYPIVFSTWQEKIYTKNSGNKFD